MDEIIHVQGLPEVITEVPRSADQNPALVYLVSLPAKSGRVSQRQVIEKIASWLGGTIESVDWGNLKYAYTIALKTKVLDSGYSPASARKFLAALRGILKNAWKLGQINADEYAKAVDLGKVGGSTLPAGRYVGEEELKMIFDSCIGPIGIRDAALIAILYGCGVRREELINLDMSDYRPDDGTLTVHGKRDKDRLAYITNGTKEALDAWIEKRGAAPGPLFLAINKSGKARIDRRLSSQMVYNTIQKRAKSCGLEHFSPHSLRRTFCSRLLDAGVDISTTAKLAGHANVTTTALYDRRSGETQRAGVQLLTIPYTKKE